MLVQPHAGQPVKDDDGEVAFHDDDYRAIGEAMILFYEKKSTRMLTPKSVLRVAELLETPEIAELNRMAGFSDPGSKKPPLGRWKRAATQWLALREKNLADAPGPREGRLQGDHQEHRAQGRLQARERGVLRGPRLEAEAGRRRPPHGRPVGPQASEARALRRPVRGGDLRGDRRRRSSRTRTSSAACRRTWASRRPSWWRCCPRCRTATCACSRPRSRSSA